MLFERQYEEDYSSLLEQELLSEECQIFTEAFLDERYDEIDYEVPVLEVVALHDIVSKIYALQEGILEEEIAVYADHETIDDYILSLMEFYEVEDPETLLETAQEVLDEGVASSIGAMANKLFPKTYAKYKRFKDFRITGEGQRAAYSKLKNQLEHPKYGTKIPNKARQRIKQSFAKIENDYMNNTLKGKYDRVSNDVKKYVATHPDTVRNVKLGAAGGAVGGTAGAIIKSKGYADGNEAGFKAGVASVPKPTPAPSVYDRVKGMGGDAKRAIMNNKGLALKTLGGAAAAGGLGYLAYKLWKNRNKKKAAAKA